MVLPALLLATSVALPRSPSVAHVRRHSPPATQVDRGRGHRHPVESGRPRQSAHVRHPRALHTSLRQVRESDWVLVVRPQHRRLLPALAPAQPRLLEPGLLLHATGERVGPWIRVYDSSERSWVNARNLAPAAAPANWARTVLKLHPQLQRRLAPQPRVSHLPLPPVAAGSVASSPATVPAATPQPVVVQQQVVVQPVVQQPAPVVRTPIQSIYFWAGQYGVNGDLLLRTAECESGLNAAAYNPSGASGGLQFMPSTFAAYSAQLQWDHTPSYWNFDDSARVAAYMWSQGQQGQWSCWYVTTQGYNPDNG